MNKCEFSVANKLNDCDLLTALFENNVIVSIVLVDISGAICLCSNKFEKEFKKDENIIGKKLIDVIGVKDYDIIRKLMLESMFTGTQVSINTVHKEKYLRFVSYPITNEKNKVTHIMISGVDISNDKKNYDEITVLKKKLEDANSVKSTFLSNVSHELRTPMNSIIGFSELLLDEKNRELSNRFLKTINSNAKYLDELLNNILDYAKIESNEFDLLYENFSLNDLLDELFLIFEDVNYKKNLDFVKLEIIKGEDKKIICDYLRLKQVLFNLISNSIKFTETGSIQVSYKECHDSLIFKVKDTGIGIAEEKLKFIYDRFWQNDSSSIKKYKGTGLGLSISKSIVEMLNGKIWVKSAINKGTTFYIKIPLEEIKQELVIIKTKDKITFSGKTILVIDELPVNFSMLTIYLNSLHVDMISAHNGKESIEIFKKQKEKIDIIILDINLPDVNGFELAREIKSIDNNFVIISKSPSYSEKNENIDFHLKKPINKNELITVLSNIWQK